MGLRRLREKLRFRRHRHLPDTDQGGEGHEAESTSDLKAKSGQRPLELPHVQLHFASSRTPSADRDISEAQISLQKAVEDLESVLQAQLGRSSDELQTSLGACLAQGFNPRDAEPLKNILIAVQQDRADRIQAASSRAGTMMQKLYPVTKLALGLTGTLTSSAGYAPVQIVTNGLIQAIELAMSVPKQSEEVVAGLDSMGADDYLLAELQKMPRDVLDDPIVLGAIVLQTRLVEFLRKSILWLNKTFFAKFANCVIEPTQMNDARTELRKSQEALRSHLSVDTYLTVKWQKIATVQAELLDSLCSSEYHTAHLLKQKELHGTRLENSGMWAVTHDKFKSWHGDTGGILWCPGLREYQAHQTRPKSVPINIWSDEANLYKAGAGKTYLASRIVDELQIAGRHRDVGVAYVYCEYNRTQQQSERLVIEAMTRQLIAQKPDLCFEFKRFLQDPLPTPHDRKILLTQVLAQFETTFLVLDALDEFSTEYSDRHRLACTLRSIVQDCSTGQVRLCITSREADRIWQALVASTVPANFLDVRSSQGDIRALVEQAYDEVSLDRAIEWACDNDQLKQLVIDKVVEKSDCIFKLADLQIRAILRQPSAQRARSALDHLTTNVNNYYNQAMERIASQKETNGMVYNLLTWLTFTRSPIHVHELELALSIRPGQSLDQNLDDQRVDVLRYVSLSEGLISINKSSLSWPFDKSTDEDGERPENKMGGMTREEISINKGAQVMLAHESIREFLRDTSQPGIPAKGDQFLLHCCLTIMNSPIFVEILPDFWQELRYREDFPSRASRGLSLYFGTSDDKMSAVKVPVFLFWVLSSWGQHVSGADLTVDMADALHRIHWCHTATSEWRRSLAGPLYWCAYEGWAEACKLLLPLEEDPNKYFGLHLDRGMTHDTEETCLFAAVASGDVATVQAFLDDDRINPNCGKMSYWQGHVSPLMHACEQGDRDIVRLVLARNEVAVNRRGSGRHGAGLPAILLAKPGIIALLLERDDLDVNILQRGRRPIHHLASMGGPPSELELLLQNTKTEVNSRTEEAMPGGRYVRHKYLACFCHKRTALMVAAFAGHPAQTSVLLKHPRIGLQLRDSQGMTALMLASVGWRPDTMYHAGDSVEQHDETVRVLLKSSDSTINERDVRGRTALILASMGGVDPKWNGSDAYSRRMRLLSWKDWNEDMVCKSSLGKDHHLKIVEALLRDDNVDVNIPDEMGHTALDYAIWTRDFIIQERGFEMQRLKSIFEDRRPGVPDSDGLYRMPDVDVQDRMTKAQSRMDAVSKIHDVLVASGGRSCEPIGPLASSQDRKLESYFLVVAEVSEQRKMIESSISALESVA